MAETPGSTPGRHDPYLALRFANYRRFALGFLSSATGLGMLSTVIGLEVWTRTQSPMALAYIGLARALPVLVMTLPAGHAADLYSRKVILALTQAGFAVTGMALAAASYWRAPMWVFYALISLSGCVRAFNGPSRSSLLPLLVPEEGPAFQNAVAWNNGAFQFSAIVGPLLAALVLWFTRRVSTGDQQYWPVYVAMALGCMVFSLSITTVHPRAGGKRTGSMTLRSMLDGMSHVYKEKTILAALLLDLFAVLLGSATAMMPIYADKILTRAVTGLEPATTLALLRSSPFVGALLMSLILAHRPPFKRAGAAMLWSVAAFGVCTIVFGLSTNLLLSLAALFLGGAFDNISVVVRHVLVQVRTPDSVRGRVSAVNSVFIESSNQLGDFESGLVARLTSEVFSVVSGGVGTILVVLGIAALLPQIRTLRKLTPEK